MQRNFALASLAGTLGTIFALAAPQLAGASAQVSSPSAPSAGSTPSKRSGAVVRLAEPTLEELRHSEIRRVGTGEPGHPGLSSTRRLYNRRVIRAISKATGRHSRRPR